MCGVAARSDVASRRRLSARISIPTPAQRHAGQDRPLLTARHELYQLARHSSTRRWSRQTAIGRRSRRMLNPKRNTVIHAENHAFRFGQRAAFPSRPDHALATARNVGEASSAAIRSHVQRPLRC